MTVGSALRIRPGLGWMLAFSAVFSLGANSLSSVLNQICNGRGTGREGQSSDRGGADGVGEEYGVLCEYGEQYFIRDRINQKEFRKQVSHVFIMRWEPVPFRSEAGRI